MHLKNNYNITKPKTWTLFNTFMDLIGNLTLCNSMEMISYKMTC